MRIRTRGLELADVLSAGVVTGGTAKGNDVKTEVDRQADVGPFRS